MTNPFSTILFSLAGQPISLGLVLVAAAGLLLGLAAGLLLPWPRAAGGRESGRAGTAAFLRGVSHLTADHRDQAIEEFRRAVSLDSGTVEIYMVLGNLFREKGEFERAVRIRQSIIVRPNLDPQLRMMAMYELGMDYRKGGLYNRAVDVWQEMLKQTPEHGEALRQLISIYEEMREWDRASEALVRLDKLTGQDSSPVLAHYKTERAKELGEAGQHERAEELYGQAIATHPGCLDAYLHLGDHYLAGGRHKKALGVWKKAVRLAPEHAHLVINRVAQAEDDLEPELVAGFFDEIDLEQANEESLLALARRHNRQGREHRALELLDRIIRARPHLMGAHRLRGEILLATGDPTRAAAALGQLLGHLDDAPAYQCASCGLTSGQLTWRCPRCHQWDTMVSVERPA